MPKFANLTQSPMSFPGPRGESVCFSPGESREGSWWSRFASKTGLSPVPDSYLPSRDFRQGLARSMRRPVVTQHSIAAPMDVRACSGACATSCQVACEGACQLACETSKQVVSVTDKYEQIGDTFHCRYCDWATKDGNAVQQHIDAYHAKAGPVEKGSLEYRSEGQQVAKDPGARASTLRADSPTVPTPGSPSPRSRASLAEKNDYWSVEEGIYLCLRCKKELNVRWTTANRPAMLRHAKNRHNFSGKP